jgi:hypothetical protein
MGSSWKIVVSGVALALSSGAMNAAAQDAENDAQEDAAEERRDEAEDRRDEAEEREEDGDRDELRARLAAAPDDAAGFGEARQWAFSSDAALSLQRSTTSDVDGSTTTVVLAPAADYFVMRNLSVGGVISLTYTKSGDNSSTRFGIGPRVGYNLQVSRLLSVWPKIGVSFAHTNSQVETTVAGMTLTDEVDSNALALNLFVPVMVHPAPHFFAGFGPFLDTDLSGDARSTVWGVKLTLGGWL